jgi:hypothetical protein
MGGNITKGWKLGGSLVAVIIVLPVVCLTAYQILCVAPHAVAIRELVTEADPGDREMPAPLVAQLFQHLEPGLGRYPGWLVVLAGPGPHEITLVATKSVLGDLGLNRVRALRWHVRAALWRLTLPAVLTPQELATLYCHYRRTRDGVTCNDLASRWQTDGS